MKIYGSTEYIQPEDVKVGNLKLEVISQWDFKTKAICYENTSTSTGKMVIPFALRKCIEVFSKAHTKWDYVTELTTEMKDQLLKDGYTLAKLTTPPEGEK